MTPSGSSSWSPEHGLIAAMKGSGPGKVTGDDPQRSRGRDPGRAAGLVRQPAPAPDRLGRSQRRAARARGQAWGSRSPSTASPRARAASPSRARPRPRFTSGSGSPRSRPSCAKARGEIAAAERGELPELVTAADLRGELHCHTTLSDGQASVEEMAEAARGRRLLLHRDHRPLGVAWLRRRRPGRRPARTGRGDRPPQRRIDSGVSGSWPAPRSTSAPTARPTTPTRCSLGSTG